VVRVGRSENVVGITLTAIASERTGTNELDNRRDRAAETPRASLSVATGGGGLLKKMRRDVGEPHRATGSSVPLTGGVRDGTKGGGLSAREGGRGRAKGEIER